MSSSFGNKLRKKLNSLGDTASKDSVQTLSNWIGFSRKHAPITATVLAKNLQDSKNNSKRQWMYWRLIHQVLVNENGNASKWEKLAQLRFALGEALQPAMKILGNAMPDQLETCLEEWEDKNVFGGPSLISQIRRLYQNRNNLATSINKPSTTKNSITADISNITSSTAKALESSSEPSGTSARSTIELNEKEKIAATHAGDASLEHITNDDDTVYQGPDNSDEDVATEKVKQEESQKKSKSSMIEKVSTKSPSPQKRYSFLNQQVDYDFESKGIPSGKVESREFLDPCKAITTLQIARDVRTNTALEISTALTNLPADVLTACQDLNSGKLDELDIATTNEFSIRIPSSLIDMDIDEESSSLNMFQDIVQRQQKAREKLIYLLLKSRCKFGSMEAARAFYEVDTLTQKVEKRKELLSDALELEGLDTSEIATGNSNSKKHDHEDLPPLTWYEPDESNKKPKVS
uniref:CID domain-containing protein n=1 Tax=Pseudo-nitzschia australis TaxID=44445 RepID=A0A7S4ERL5_9STRA|mmetsp:Transcript_40/g.104  ORF Transcript_40/g.104 Transcript_40/m.104 type:complete len:464 (-) Transcript_40:185-1576(-)